MNLNDPQAPLATVAPPTMRAMVLDRFGDEGELSFREIPTPQVGDDDVLVRVEFAGLGSWDAVERRGAYEGAFGFASTFPYVLGWDAAGTVASVGRNVTAFKPGDRVYAATLPVKRGGFYAEYGVVEAEFVAHVPERLPTEQAAAMGWDALTALTGLELLDLETDQTLMIFGASGGVGHMAVQLARHQGARVLAVASGQDGVALARRLGADFVVDGRDGDVSSAVSEFAPRGLDAALMAAGGETAERLLSSLKESGKVAVPNGVEPAVMAPEGATVVRFDADRRRRSTDRLNALIEAGALEVHVAQTFSLERAVDAHLALREHYVGKLALQVAADGAS